MVNFNPNSNSQNIYILPYKNEVETIFTDVTNFNNEQI